MQDVSDIEKLRKTCTVTVSNKYSDLQQFVVKVGMEDF